MTKTGATTVLPPRPAAWLALVAVGLLSPAVAEAGKNHLKTYDLVGQGAVLVKMQGKKVEKVDVTMPGARINLTCGRSGYRPLHVLYGFPPLLYGTQRGHAQGQFFSPNKDKLASREMTFPARAAWSKSGNKKDRLAGLKDRAMALCQTGKHGGTLTETMDVQAICKRVSMGLGKDTNMFERGRTATFAVTCAGAAPAPKKQVEPPAQPGSRRGRPSPPTRGSRRGN